MEGKATGGMTPRKWCVSITLFLFSLFLSLTPALVQNQTIGAGLEGQALIDYIQQNYTPSQVLGY